MASSPPPSSRVRRAASAVSLRQSRQFSPANSTPTPRRPNRSPKHIPAYQDSPYQDSHPFPSVYTPASSSSSNSRSPSRSETHTSHVPQLRFSGSSSYTHHEESPLATPVDSMFASASMYQYPAVVAVETMDALVDGMNNISQLTSSSRSGRYDSITNHQAIHHPPLPTPPPGIVLGPRKAAREPESGSSSADDEQATNSAVFRSADRSRRKRMQRQGVRRAEPPPSTTSTPSATPPTPPSQLPQYYTNSRTPKPYHPTSSSSSCPVPSRSRSATNLSSLSTPTSDRPRTAAPSISEIIRNHTPPSSTRRYSVDRSASYQSLDYSGNPTLFEEPVTEEEMVSRSSVDSIADEVQRTILHHKSFRESPSSNLRLAPSLARRHSVLSGRSTLSSPVSDGTSSFVTTPYTEPASPGLGLADLPPPTASEAIARYLRSTRLTTLLKLTRSPHASLDNPLTVSLSDLGQSDGFPLVVFLGLGCVRHVMGLYDEMAQILGLRLIAIDRWGLGRTEPRSKTAKGIQQWAAVVEEVLDKLKISQCSVMAHSAGAPYALSFANRYPDRVVGKLCLLAPWVGGRDGGTYKWLRYVPNGLLKTAQAAEWKLQAWNLGRPPTMSYEGIGYNADRPFPKRAASHGLASTPQNNGTVYLSATDSMPRPSLASSSFSDYDDLRDFQGRFDSRSTVGGTPPPVPEASNGNENKMYVTRKRSTRSLFGMLKGGGSPYQDQQQQSTTGRRLKSLKSVSSLRSKAASPAKAATTPSSPQLPPSAFSSGDLSIDFDACRPVEQTDGMSSSEATLANVPYSTSGRSFGQRSVSLHHGSPRPQLPPSPNPTISAETPISASNEYQAALGNALIAASHAESAKGTHNDLLQILNHENHSWGFSYSAYPHMVEVWYGEKDEKIAENAVRWMQKTMGEDRCSMTVVKGADHSLMYKSSVVVEVLERITGYWSQNTNP